MILWAVPVQAQLPVEPPSKEYKAAITMGLEEFELGHYAEARARLLEAHRMLPSARTLRGLGKVEYELRHYGAAIEYLRSALKSQARPLTLAQRKEVEDLIEKARGYSATITLDLSPPDARLSLDGEDVEAG